MKIMSQQIIRLRKALLIPEGCLCPRSFANPLEFRCIELQ